MQLKQLLTSFGRLKSQRQSNALPIKIMDTSDCSSDNSIPTKLKVIKRKLDWESAKYLSLLDQTQILYEKILTGGDLEKEVQLLVALHNECGVAEAQG